MSPVFIQKGIRTGSQLLTSPTFWVHFSSSVRKSEPRCRVPMILALKGQKTYNEDVKTKRGKNNLLPNLLLHFVFDTFPLNYIPKMTRNFAEYLVKCFFNCTFVAKSLRIFFLRGVNVNGTQMWNKYNKE